METRIILHVDMDYFYAQIEERENPSLRGRPVAVCMVSAREGSLGAIAACNYGARHLGLHSGMPCFLAKKKAPDCVFLPARREFYVEVSSHIMDELKGYCDVMEQVSVDEAYLDVSSRMAGFQQVEDYLRRVKSAVLGRERLTCSVGAGPNKLLAKMASSVNKPDGHYIIAPDGVDSFLLDMPVSKLHGVGGKTEQTLSALGVATVGDLRNISLERLASDFGAARGKLLYDHCRGIDASPIAEREREQYGRLASLRTDTRQPEELSKSIRSLSEDVHRRLIAEGVEYRTVAAVFVLKNLQMRARSRTLPAPTQSLDTLADTAISLMKEFLSEESSPIRRIGVTASSITHSTGQKSLSEY